VPGLLSLTAALTFATAPAARAVSVPPATIHATDTLGRILTFAANSPQTILSSPTIPLDVDDPFTALNGGSFGMDFNPVQDLIRVVSSADQNLRINPTNGQVITDSPLDARGSETVSAAAYSNNFAGASSTVLYDINFSDDTLYQQIPPNNGTLVPVGGPLGVVTLSTNMGFDIVHTTTGDHGFAPLTVGGTSGLYNVNFATGAVTLVGAIGGGAQMTGMAASPFSKPAVVRSSTNWLLRTSLTSGVADQTFMYGAKPLVPIFGDWDGNGSKTPGTFEGGVFKLRNSNTAGPLEEQFNFGDQRGFPLAGDFNGDALDDVAVYRSGLWQVRLSTGAESSFTFGSGNWPATVPVSGDWDGDGVDGVGTFVAGTWTLRSVATSAGVDSTVVFGPGSNPYPVVGDWNGDLIDTVGIKSATGTTWQLSNSNTSPAPHILFDFGQANTDLPLAWR
jgi:hypothetical protein